MSALEVIIAPIGVLHIGATLLWGTDWPYAYEQ